MKTFFALATAAIAFTALGTSSAQAGESYSRTTASSQSAHHPSRSAVYSGSAHSHNHYHNHVGFHNRAFRGCGPTPVQVYNYGYRSTWPMYYNRQLRDYNVYRSYPTSRGRFFGFWR